MANVGGNIGIPANGFYLNVEFYYTQNIDGNSTTITNIVAKVTKNNSTYRPWNSSKSASIQLQYQNDSNGWVTATTLSNNSGYDMRNTNTIDLVAGSNINIPHKSDGKQNLRIIASVNGQLSNYYPNGSIDKTVGLPEIPRATTPKLSASEVVMGNSITIDLPRASGSFTHKLYHDFWVGSWTEFATDIATSTTFTVPTAWASRIPSMTSGQCRIRCLTYSGSTLIGEKIVSFNATVPDSVVPTVDTITVTEAVDGLATKFEAFIQNKSKLKIVSSGSGAGGSTISSYSVKVLGTTYTGDDITTNYINQSGTVDIEVTATDSRGRTGTKTIQVEILEYFTPTIKSFKAFRSGTDGKEQSGSKTLRCEYNFVIASCNEKNDNTYTIEYKASNASTWTNLTTGNEYTLSGSISSPNKLALEYSYEVRLTINDYFNTPATYTVKIGTETVPLCVYPTGKGLGIGGYPTKEALQVFMKAEFLNDVSHANTEHFQNGLTQNIQVLTGKNCKNITTSGLYYMSGGTYRPVNVDGWLEVMKYDANTVAQIYTTKTGQKYVRYMKNGIWDNNWRGGMSNVEKLWSGTLSKGGKVTIANLDLYDTFILGCSNGTAMLIGTRYYDPSGNRGTTVLFSTAHDDGTSSYVYKATTSMSGTTFTLISASTHTLQNNGNVGSSMSVKSLYGVM